MRSKAPDTRGKLDSNRGLNVKKKPVLVKRAEVVVKEGKSLKDLKKQHTPQSIKDKLKKKVSNGQLFKEKNGYTKSMSRAMNNAGVSTMEEYRPIRKQRKVKARKISQDKRALSRTKRSLKTDKKQGKKKG